MVTNKMDEKKQKLRLLATINANNEHGLNIKII